MEKDLFDYVAPIHIYFNADIKYKQKAEKAFRYLKKHKKEAERYLDDITVLEQRNLDDVDPYVFWRAYNNLFEEEVLSYFPELEPSYDRWGARCFVFNGKRYLSGDSYDCYPFYVSKKALEERLKELANEICEAL